MEIFRTEKFRPYEKGTRPITPKILIYQKISLVSKLFRFKRSTKKVSCEFSEKSIFRKVEISFFDIPELNIT